MDRLAVVTIVFELRLIQEQELDLLLICALQNMHHCTARFHKGLRIISSVLKSSGNYNW